MAEERIWGEAYVRPGNTALRRALRELRGCQGRVLEVGCGAGRFIRTIKRTRADLDAFGCDVSTEAVRLGRTYGDAVQFTAADLTALPYADGQFEAVVLFDVLEHLDDPVSGLREVHRVLRPGGLLHALVPCEGQPLTLHWLLWRLGMAADLKERHGAHVQRFSRHSLLELMQGQGFAVRGLTYSMHPLGQVRDVLTYLAQEPWCARWARRNPLYRAAMAGLWAGAYGESTVLAGTGVGAVVMHVTATRQGMGKAVGQ